MTAPDSTASRLRWLALAAALVGSGPLIGGFADRSWSTAVLLHAEPLLLCWACVVTWLLLLDRRRLPAVLVLVGALGAAVGVRAPIDVPLPEVPHPVEPEWLADVADCAADLRPPSDEVRVLQWTISGAGEATAIHRAGVQLRPDVVVLRGPHSPNLLERLREDIGAEYHTWRAGGAPSDEVGDEPPEPGEESVTVLTRGVFHRCGEEASEWTWVIGGIRRSFTFVGITPDTIVPLMVTRYPGPWATLDMARVQDAMATDAWLVARLHAHAMVVVADAPSPHYRHLDRWFAQAQLLAAASPPNWPMALGPVPVLPLLAYDRLWVSPDWRVDVIERLPVHTGLRAPVISVLTPAQVIVPDR